MVSPRVARHDRANAGLFVIRSEGAAGAQCKNPKSVELRIMLHILWRQNISIKSRVWRIAVAQQHELPQAPRSAQKRARWTFALMPMSRLTQRDFSGASQSEDPFFC